MALGIAEICGGKGANQAVAASRAGGQVTMIGRVGDDIYSKLLQANLEREAIECTHVLTTENCNSGVAVVSVAASAENSILVVAGANARLSKEDIMQAATAIRSADCLLLQLEIPVATAVAAIQIARQAGIRVILNPAPIPGVWTDELLQVDLVCPNQTEAEQLVGFSFDNVEAIEKAARRIRDRGADQVIITLGERGAAALIDDHFQLLPALPVQAVDTTAAGDAFVGALAVRWSETNDLHLALPFALAAGAIAVSRNGAQPSLPSRAEIQHLIS